jgi:hypothetical protein
MRSWVESLMDVCINIFCTNAIYKHVHHDEYANMYIMANGVKTFFLTKLGEKQKKKKLYIFSCHVILSQHIMTNYNL